MLGFLTLSINNHKPNSGKMSVENTELFTGLRNDEFRALITSSNRVYLLSGYQGVSSHIKDGCWNIISPDFEDLAGVSWHVFTEARALSVKTTLPKHKFQWQEPDFESFKDKFEELQKAFVDTPLVKAVPIIFAKSSLDKQGANALISTIVKLQTSVPETYSYGLWSKNGGILGRTPEILFSYDGSELQTMALAGTANIDRDDQDFMGDPKEIDEHELVRKDIQSRLEAFGEVKSSSLGIKKLSKIKHLKTELSLSPKGSLEFSEVVKTLHPTPALGVAPRSELQTWLRNLSVGEDRKKYGAPFGWVDPQGNMTCLVAIRNIQWSGDILLLGSGCGIIRQSQLDNEWKELSLKREQVKEDLGL